MCHQAGVFHHLRREGDVEIPGLNVQSALERKPLELIQGMRTRDERLGGRFHPGVGLDQVSAQPILLLTLAFLHQHNTHHEPGLLLPRQYLPHDAQFLLGNHIIANPLPFLKAIPDGALPNGGVILDLEAEWEFRYQADRIPKHKPSL